MRFRTKIRIVPRPDHTFNTVIRRIQQSIVAFYADAHFVAFLDFCQIGTLLIQNIQSDSRRNRQTNFRKTALDAFFFQQVQRMYRCRFRGTNQPFAAAIRTRRIAGFQKAGMQALAGQFHQAEPRNASHLDTGAIAFQRFFHPAFNGMIVSGFFHIDKVDNDQARHIAQAQLARDFVGGFQICLQRRFFNIAFFGRTTRVHVNGNQRFRLIHDQISARFQLYDIAVQRFQLRFNLITEEQRHVFLILLDFFRMAGSKNFHKILCHTVFGIPFNQDFRNIARVHIAQCTLDQVAFFVNQAGSRRFHRFIAHLNPRFDQIFVVSADFKLCAFFARRADDYRHSRRQRQFGNDGFQTFSVRRIGNFARNAAAARVIRHQNAITSRQRQISRQRRTFVAAFFFGDLNQ